MVSEEEIKNLVIARIEATPDDVGISFGDFGELDKSQLIEHIRTGDEIGQRIIDVQLNYVRAMKEGLIYANE